MAGSTTGKEVVEGEQRRSLWVSNVEHKLLILKEELHNKLDDFRILKVPEYDRQPTAAYSPVGWRFGLHNRAENLDTIESEAAKLAVVVLFGLDEQSKWINFCDTVVPDPKMMLTCYGLHREVTDLLEDEVKQVLAFDALFLAVYIDFYHLDWEDLRLWTSEHLISDESRDSFLSTFNRWNVLVPVDLCKIENQIPFIFIKRAIKHIKRLTNAQYEDEDHAVSDAKNGDQVHKPSPDQLTQLEAKEGIMGRAIKCIKKLTRPEHEDEHHPITDGKAGRLPDPYLEIWMKEAVITGISDFMDISDDFYKDANEYPRLLESHHILDAAYKAICGVSGMQRTSNNSQNDYIHIPSARRLKNSGIKIVGVVGPLCAMSYNKKKKCLFLPKMRIYDETVALIRNMTRYEEYSEDDKCILHDYVFLMLDLVGTPSDLKYLTKCGVISNECGERAFDMWKALEQGLTDRESSKEHNEMKRDINNRCNFRWYSLWSEFITLFFSRPWLTLSTIVIVVVTLATLLQTYTSIIGTNRMKPQF